MTSTPAPLADWRPRPDHVRHSYRCSRRAPLLDAVRELDDGRTVEFKRCSSCGGSDLTERLLDQLDRHPGDDAA